MLSLRHPCTDIRLTPLFDMTVYTNYCINEELEMERLLSTCFQHFVFVDVRLNFFS